MRPKVSVIGAGNVGATVAQRLVDADLADVRLVDIIEGLPQGKALDLLQCGPITGSDAYIAGTNSYEATAGSDVVVVTSGVVRKPGMSRDDLVLTNMNIVKTVTERVMKYSPDCLMVMVANPLDAMTQLALKISGLPKTRVFGQSGVLDGARFRTFVAQELKVSVEDVFACVLGGHGDTMVPIPRLSTVAGIPLPELIPPEKLKNIVARTVNGGAEIVSLLKTGSAYYAPGTATALMVEAILKDKKRIMPCATLLEGEYGINGIVVGVPVKLGRQGIEQVIELKLMPEESAALVKSAEAVREMLRVMKLE
jgi:malate dehydrogenase